MHATKTLCFPMVLACSKLIAEQVNTPKPWRVALFHNPNQDFNNKFFKKIHVQMYWFLHTLRRLVNGPGRFPRISLTLTKSCSRKKPKTGTAPRREATSWKRLSKKSAQCATRIRREHQKWNFDTKQTFTFWNFTSRFCRWPSGFVSPFKITNLEYALLHAWFALKGLADY